MQHSIIGKSVRGASHVRADKECQDSFRIKTFDDGCVAIAVADGHGSKSCPYSKSGSTTAVNTFCSIMADLHKSYMDRLDDLQTYLNREGDMGLAKSIEHEWKRRVIKNHSNEKRDVIFNAEGKKDLDSIYMQYGTTLVGLFITPKFTFAFQLGDGDIQYITDETIGLVIQCDKILGVETHSLCKKNAWKSAVTSVSRIDNVTSGLYMLSTDGLVNSYLNNNEFCTACEDYYKLIKEHGTKKIEPYLSDWLSETSEKGCGDDITVVFAYYPKEFHNEN